MKVAHALLRAQFEEQVDAEALSRLNDYPSVALLGVFYGMSRADQVKFLDILLNNLVANPEVKFRLLADAAGSPVTCWFGSSNAINA